MNAAGEGGSSNDGSSNTGGFSLGNGDKCTPKSCDELDAECGAASDGCGDVVECGTCDDDQACGIEAPNMCTTLADLCQPVSKSKACKDKECGSEGDGCGGVYDCGSCEAGESCGEKEAFQCAQSLIGTDPDHCPSKIEDCESVGVRCGVIGDGCGGTIDCTEELGQCPDGTYCGVVEPYQCSEPPEPDCTKAESCAELGWECGLAIDDCGNIYDCADEGRVCGNLEVCVGGIDGPTECQGTTGGGGTCELCGAIPGCTSGRTRLSGRVITPGRNDSNTENQLGVPNAFVYILRNNKVDELPPIPAGIPENGTSCDRCTDQVLGPVLSGATTDAAGNYTIDDNIPIGEEFLLVVKVGRFRRAMRLTLPESAACKTTNLPAAAAENPTRLPRSMSDGLAVNIPRVAVSTGQLDAMECVFEKMGIAHSEFGNPGDNGNASERIHLYRGGVDSGDPPGSGARIDDDTPHDTELYGSSSRLSKYDMIVADCEGPTWDSGFLQRDANGNKVREYVNRGGRMFASHLSFSWIHDNGSAIYSENDAIATGLAAAATFQTQAVVSPNVGTGIISLGRPNASPRIENFRDWMVNENVTSAPDYEFSIFEPRSQVNALGSTSEEFVHCDGGDCSGNYRRTQQFSFNTPYGAPVNAACGRVAYSGFHVAIGSTTDAVFPSHCGGALTDQEKVLLYMLFDLGACVGEEPEPPSCTPIECSPERCGPMPDGCGGIVDCGPCEPPPCIPTTCDAEGAECGKIGDGCGKLLECGTCSDDQICGAKAPNQCGSGSDCMPLSCGAVNAECGMIGDGCGGAVDCGKCPAGEVCGLKKPFRCDPPPPCEPIECDDVGAECGVIGDGCGGIVDCGGCREGETCGASTPNRCSELPE